MSPSDWPFLHVQISPELKARLEDFRFARRFKSEAEGVRWLLGWALDQELEAVAAEKREARDRKRKTSKGKG